MRSKTVGRFGVVERRKTTDTVGVDRVADFVGGGQRESTTRCV